MADKPNYNEFFIEMEHKWLKHWYEKGTVNKYLHKNDTSSKRFSFQDGPITANNPMGVHHAWGRTYKDLWQKFHNLLGYKQRFQNGFDCQGLWVEVEVEKELKLKSKKDIENLVPGNKFESIAKFVQLCKDRVLKFSGIQTEQTKRLGNFMDWDNSYFTMSDDNNYMIWRFLKKVYENGWMYKGHDTVPWCPRCETAISQHEMLTEDYKELTHETVFFKLPITTKGWENTFLLVWTTTPWTIPANVAVAVNTNYTYRIWRNSKTGEKIIFIIKDENGKVPSRALKKGEVEVNEYIFQDVVSKDVEFIHDSNIKDIQGKDLIGLKYDGPFDNLPIVQNAKNENSKTFHTVIDGSEVVVSTEGTGLLHVAPGAGQEDFQLGKANHLSVIAPILDNADYVSQMGEFSGKNAKKHPEIIIDYLEEKDKGKFLFKTMRYTHRYPACWRCKAELVWKVTDEWYIAMDKSTKDDKRTLRQRMVDVAKKIKWMPEFGLDRELDWLKNMHDWLISKKNRYWGLALPIYECKKCGHFEVIGSREELKERAVKGWDTFEGHTPHKPYIDEVIIKCSKCAEETHRTLDVGNPWLDAGIVPYSTMKDNNQGEPLYLKSKEDWKKWFPANFITESFPGQFKNWFYAMIAMSTVLEDTNPYKRVLGFATLVGEDGRPMHKSWGNSVEFNQGANELGVDVMRWMYARQNPTENLLFGPNKANEVRRQFYLLLWNIYKFYRDYAVIDKCHPDPAKREKDPDWILRAVYPAEGGAQNDNNILDKWLLARFAQTAKTVEESLKEYNARDAAASVETFISDFSTWYVRRSRDRVGLSVQNGKDKTSFYETTHYVLKNLAVILSPFMPFITEELYTNLTKGESVHLESWPVLGETLFDDKLISDIQLVRSIAEAAHRVRKELKLKVRQPLAKVVISRSKSMKYSHEPNTALYDALLKDELNVKIVEYKDSKGEIAAEYDTNITPQLKLEGEVRDLIRTIQQKRKELGLQISDSISLTVPSMYKQFEEQIKRQVQANVITYGETVEVTQS